MLSSEGGIQVTFETRFSFSSSRVIKQEKKITANHLLLHLPHLPCFYAEANSEILKFVDL